MSGEIEIVRQWLYKAKNDLLNADNNLKSEEVPFEPSVFIVSKLLRSSSKPT